MNTKYTPQYFTTPGGEEMAVLPRGQLDALIESVEDKIDAAEAMAIMARVESGEEETFPGAVVDAILDDENPIKIFRKHRHMTQKQLAETVGINSVYLSQVERGERNASTRLLARLANALNLDVEDLS